jgi:hypothetical protein
LIPSGPMSRHSAIELELRRARLTKDSRTKDGSAMRQARFLPPRRTGLSRIAALLGLVLTGWGCQQPPTYFYYGYGAPPCVPVVPAPAARKAGEPATEVIEGGMTTIDAPGRTTTVIGSEAPPRVVVSEPEAPPRGSWRRSSNPDQTIATSVDGGVRTTGSSDPTVTQ